MFQKTLNTEQCREIIGLKNKWLEITGLDRRIALHHSIVSIRREIQASQYYA